MLGYIHSIQSLGAVDGPGLRCIVFMQGCPLRCVYCHNPDTWTFRGGEAVEADQLVKRLLRYRPYFGKSGGVTVSGGEPLMQAEFIAELFRLLHEENIHTAVDTAGAALTPSVEKLLTSCDLVLADLKFSNDEDYKRYAGSSLKTVTDFLNRCEELNIPLWIRHVVVPGLNDNAADISKIQSMAQSYKNLEKIEWLPFHRLGLEKYQEMKINYPLKDTPNLNQEQLDALICEINVPVMPAAVYPKQKLAVLRKEIEAVKSKIVSGEQPMFTSVDSLFDKLEGSADEL